MSIRLVLVGLLATTTLLAQSKDELEIKALFWGKNDPYDTITEIPEKWKNESAVIIYKNENYIFHKTGANVKYTRSLRKRIKLLDKAAVEEFSTFSFTKRFRSTKGTATWKKKGKTVVGVKLVKTDGTEVDIDVEKDAVEVDEKTNLAIANLEVGDIIDFYAYMEEPFKSAYPFRFDAVEETLAEEYPILDYKLFFETENNFFVNFNSYNGAPQLKTIRSNQRNFRKYELTDSDIEKHEDVRWFYPLAALPCYKFQVHFSPSGSFAPGDQAFVAKSDDEIRTHVGQKELLESYAYTLGPLYKSTSLKKFLKERNLSSQEEQVTAAYYFMRHHFLTRYVEAFYAQDANLYTNPFAVYGNAPIIRNEVSFINYFTKFLKDQKIPYEIVLATKRTDGPIGKLLIEDNVYTMVKVLTPTPMYASYFGVHTNLNEYPALLAGTDVYLMSATKKTFDVIEDGTLPVSSHKDNQGNFLLSFTLNEDFSRFDLKSESRYNGFLKNAQLNDRLVYTDYINEDYAMYGTKSFTQMIPNASKREKVENELKALDEKLKERQKEDFKDRIQKEYGIDEAEGYAYSIEETGRYGLGTNFTFTESFSAKADVFLKKAGPNYIIEIGKLIGSQIALTEKERNRTEDIYFDFPRSFNYEIRFVIPKGYSVSGLEKFNKTVENSTGAFISTAIIEGDELVITTSKQYRTIYEPNSNWPLIMAFLDEAYQFTNEKILLKKD